MTPDQNKFARAHIKYTVLPVLIALLTFGTILCPASVLAEISKSGEPARSSNSSESGPATQSTESINSELASHVNLLTELIAREKYSEAAECAQMALELNSAKVGKDNASNAKFLTYLGWLEQKLGRMGDARSHFELAIKLCDNEIAKSTSALPQTGTNPNTEFSARTELAIALNNLGTLLYTQGDYVSALSNFERALSVNEKLLPENDMKVAQNSKNLAGAMDACGRTDAALQHYQRAIAIMEKQEKPADSELAQILDDYACSLEDKGRFDEALQLFEKALTLKEKVYSGDHLELASSLNNIGVLKMDTHKESAEKFFDRAIAISEKALGQDHIELVAEVDNRADFDFIQMNYGLAAKGYVRAAAIINRFFKNVLPYCSNAEKQALFDQYSHDQISRLLSVCKSGPMLSSAYEMILPWKGTLVNSLAMESRIRKADLDSELREKANKLSQVRSELSAWYLEAGSTRSHWAERNAQLTREKEELERALSAALKTSPSDINSSADSLVSFRSVLKDGEAFVDIYEFDQIGTKDGNLTRKAVFGAIIVTPQKETCDVSFVELGDSASIKSSLKNWYDEVQSLSTSTSAFQVLSSKLKPIFNQLPVAVSKLWICPDGDLARIPWTLLAESETSTSKLLLCQIDSANELFALRRNYNSTSVGTVPKGNSAENGSNNRSPQVPGAPGIESPQLHSDNKSNTKSVLVLGGVDFDGGADLASAADRKSGSPILFPPLPGSLVEANKITLLAKNCNFSVVELTGKAASKSNFLKNLAGNSFVHLATHGFFFDESSNGSMAQSMEKKSRGVQIKERIYAGLESRNPLVESGLAFSGANLFNQNTQESKPGVLTAEELVDADMRNCQLVVLSACDTGRGKQLTGQGVLGLRSSVMAAGARNVLMSLWKIPDDVTVLLMDEFYKNLWQENLAPAQALRKAQANLQKQLPPAISKPKFWAGWVLVGEGW